MVSHRPLDALQSIVGHRGDFKKYGIIYEEQQGATEAYIHIDRISTAARGKAARAHERRHGFHGLWGELERDFV
ncbi:MAG: hypothetical protein ACI9T9_002121 [Oleiphilaceae bacterium]|jgi:hypothetical protein